MPPENDSESAFVASVQHFFALASPGVPAGCWTEALLAHPSYPTVIALVDSARVAGIECAVVRADDSTLTSLSSPSLLYIPSASGNFAVLERVENDRVLWRHPDAGRQWVTRQTLAASWSGIAVTIERKMAASAACSKRRAGAGLFLASALTLLLVAVLSAGAGSGATALGNLAVVLAGVAVSFGLSARNSRIGRLLCSSTRTANCHSLQHSAYGSFLGWPLTDWAAVWFLAGSTNAVCGVVTGFADATRTWAWVSFLGVGIALASVVFQATQRLWCTGCLTIDALLLADAAISWRSDPSLAMNGVPLLLASGAVALVVIAVRADARKGEDRWKFRYWRLKRNPSVLAVLLSHTKEFPPADYSPRIQVGPAGAPLDVALVSSPYCPACADLHHEATSLLRSAQELRLSIIFQCDANHEATGVRLAVAAHALEHLGRHPDAVALIESWYDAIRERRAFDDAKFNKLLSTIPAGAIETGRASVRAQTEWAQSNGITATPLLLLNGRLLPDEYEIADLIAMDGRSLSAALLPLRSASQ